MPKEKDNRTPCPHCGRKFNEDVAARHIPKCRDTVHRPKGPPQKKVDLGQTLQVSQKNAFSPISSK
jgi:hypothetical protein